MTTIAEIETKKTGLEAKLGEFAQKIPQLTFGTDEYDTIMSDYLATKAALTRIPDELVKAKQDENAEQIKNTEVAFCEAITKMIESSKIEELLGTEVLSLRYFSVDSKNEAGEVIKARGVVFNPITKVTSTGTRKTSESQSHRVKIVNESTNEELSVTKFVQKFADDTDLDSDSKRKYPHVVIDSQPKFDEFIKKHNLNDWKRIA